MQYDEADIAELIKNEYFLACIDTFRRGLINGFDVQNKVYPDGNLPRDLSDVAYARLQIEIGRRLWDGRLSLPPDIESRHPDAYRPNIHKGDQL
jgi:hypothetical protein